MIPLASGEEFLWRPVLAGLCRYRDVTENRVDLCDLATMNELLDVQAINNRRLENAARQEHERQARMNAGPFHR